MCLCVFVFECSAPNQASCLHEAVCCFLLLMRSFHLMNSAGCFWIIKSLLYSDWVVFQGATAAVEKAVLHLARSCIDQDESASLLVFHRRLTAQRHYLAPVFQLFNEPFDFTAALQRESAGGAPSDVLLHRPLGLPTQNELARKHNLCSPCRLNQISIGINAAIGGAQPLPLHSFSCLHCNFSWKWLNTRLSLVCPQPDVWSPAALLEGAAAPHGRLRRPAPQRAVGGSDGPDPRPPLPAGRRPHLLLNGPGELQVQHGATFSSFTRLPIGRCKTRPPIGSYTTKLLNGQCERGLSLAPVKQSLLLLLQNNASNGLVQPLDWVT